jgi:tRNA(Phe) wybutosine-synthesizing methylase Tyw3
MTFNDSIYNKNFKIHKLKQINEFKDLSRKSSVDEYIQELIDYINQTENYFTTSSCSGLISRFVMKYYLNFCFKAVLLFTLRFFVFILISAFYRFK